MFTIRAVILDYYMSKPFSDIYDKNKVKFNQSSLEPVIRIFGSTPEGQKSCVHVHGAFPYIYVPYKGGDNPQRDALILGAALDTALKAATEQHNYNFIWKVSVVAGIPLYGYHGTARQFYKIFFYNPYSIKKASDLLLAGAVLGQKLQPHEAHIPYTLQFMIDNDIYGMSFVSFSKIKYRKNLERPESLNGISNDVILSEKIKKITCSYFEVDALVTDIILKNKTEMTTSNPGLQAIWEDEKTRRRIQNKPSQIGIEKSQSRKDLKVNATEAMYKNMLAQKLQNIILSDTDYVDLNASEYSYPAGLLENSYTENSILYDGEKYQPETLEDFDHMSLIDITVLGETKADLSQIGEEVEEAEADSVLGKHLKKGEEEEEEVELEGEDGGDMTQSLEELLNNPVSSSNDDQSKESGSSACEEEFWRKMAGKIFQFDGAQDSSSDTDVETSIKVGVKNNLLEKNISGNATSFSQEFINNTWSTLSENDLNHSESVSLIDFPIDCSNYSPKIDCLWLPPNDEPWNWDKSDFFSDCFSSKSQAVNVSDLVVTNTTIKSSESITAKDIFENYFSSNQTDCFSENYITPPPINSLGNLKSICGSSSSPITSIVANENTNYILSNSNCDISTEICKSSFTGRNESDVGFIASKKSEIKAIPKQSLKVTLAKDFKNLKKEMSVEEKSKETSSLTLKEYLKDFGEIVNVDFKNFNDQEMVVVEYKPFSSTSNQNKFLIKPLNTFLENWDTAEKKKNMSAFINKRKTSNLRKGKTAAAYLEEREPFETNDRRFSSSTSFNSSLKRVKTKINSTKNEYVLKSTKIVPENSELCYTNKNEKEKEKISQKTNEQYSKKLLYKNLKQNLVKLDEINQSFSNFSNGEKDQNENHISSYSSHNLKNIFNSDEDAEVKMENLKYFNRKNKSKPLINNLNLENRKFLKKKFVNEKKGKISIKNLKENLKEKNISELDFKLVEEINLCFEKYFKNIIRINNCFNEKCKNLFFNRKNRSDNESELSSSEEYSDVYNKKKFISLCEKNPNVKKLLESNSKSIKFIAQFLSAFSEMSRFSETPPLAITIKVGDRKNLMSAPVQLNLKSRSRIEDKETESKCKKSKKKLKIESVDGPADSSSTDDSAENEDQLCFRKKIKGGKYYKSLNVVLCKSSGKEKIVKKRKRKSSECSSTFDDVFNSGDCRDRKNSSKKVKVDSFDVCSKNQEEPKQKIQKQNESEKKRSSKNNLTKFKNHSENVEVGAQTKNYLMMLEKEKHSQLIMKTSPIASTSGIPKSNVKIPQTDVDFSCSSDDEKFVNRTIKKKFTRKMKHGEKNFFTSTDDKATANFDNKEKYSSDNMDNIILNEQLIENKNSQNYDSENTYMQNLDDLLNKTCFKIPSKWYDAEELEDNPKSVTLKSNQISSSPSSCLDNLKNYEKNSSPPWNEYFCSTVDSSENCKSQSRSPILSEKSSASSSSYDNIRTLQKTENDKAKNVLEQENKKNLELKSFKSRKIDDSILLSLPKIIIPKIKPPSRQNVLDFLSEHQNLKSLNEVPYYSDPKDVKKPMEIGPVVLKVETNAVCGLKPYKSDLVELETEDRRNCSLSFQNQKNEKVRQFLVAGERIIVTPLQNPPFSSSVLKWLNSKNKTPNELGEKSSKIKVYVPLSPDQDSASDDEVDLSATIESLSGNYQKSESDSIVSSDNSQNMKNIIDHAHPTRSPNQVITNVDSTNKEKKKSKKKYWSLQTIEEEIQFLNDTKIETSKQEPKSSGDSNNSSSLDDKLLSKEKIKNSNSSFGIKGVTLNDTFGFSHSVENFQKIKVNHLHQHITLLIIELHVETRKDLRPDPKFDSIKALFYTITFDSPNHDQETGVIVVRDQIKLSDSHIVIYHVQNETDLINQLIKLIKEWDPDILAGYEIEMNSWGYLVHRGFILEINLVSLLARVQTESSHALDKYKEENNEIELEDIPKSVKNLKILGRIILDIWRLLRHEVTLNNYTFENVMYHVAQERHPLIPFKALTDYWKEPSHKYVWITFQYYISRVKGEIKILEQLDFINRTSELARLFGIQFFEVLSRGSQFRVESMMLRLAKTQNYIAVSPSIKQRAEMRAPASLPLILEPESLFYSDPVIVLDFQSLYPSMIIAYNYCFSTCLGRLEKLGKNEPFEFGCTQLQILAKELKDMQNDIHISPAGVAFVNRNIRKGVLPAMLEEILETRLIVKKSMKENKNDKLLLKVLHARQLGLKLIANVTYGYTAANFSGRMPCIEVGDSIVSKGRETLHRAIELIKNNPRWGAKVVYGDTDSIFVLTPRKTREEAFEIGAEIAEAVTQDNPKPVKLKLEKVYQPCILQTKKRYVGYMFESSDQKKPILEAKGIETVRRDGCPAVKKILQKALQILFDTKDVSLVKKYTIRQFIKLFENRINLQDLIFAKEYRGRAGYRPGACVPALELARQRTRYDKRAEPRVKERVPYVIVNGLPGVPLIRLVRSPSDLLEDPSLRINAIYYITKAIIPPMHRCFSLLGVDVSSWYLEMPKKEFRRFNSRVFIDRKKQTLSQYFSNTECALCSNITTNPVCNECKKRPQALTVGLIEKIRTLERRHQRIIKICQSCYNYPVEPLCQSVDCPVLFRRIEFSRDLEQIPTLRDVLYEQTVV